jgi:hypothetical protein
LHTLAAVAVHVGDIGVDTYFGGGLDYVHLYISKCKFLVLLWCRILQEIEGLSKEEAISKKDATRRDGCGTSREGRDQAVGKAKLA